MTQELTKSSFLGNLLHHEEEIRKDNQFIRVDGKISDPGGCN